MTGLEKIDSFNFPSGRLVSNRKYEIVTKIGEGWESEVYIIRELQTGIERAAKFFFPHRNVKNKNSIHHAKKLHRLRDCQVLVRYLSQDELTFKKVPVTFMISDLVEGVPLSEFIAEQPGQRLQTFEALHLLAELARGVSQIHRHKEYHGDLHTDNVIVKRHGLGFKIRILDLFNWQAPKTHIIQEDVYNLLKMFYEMIGGNRFYSKQPVEVRKLCLGFRRSAIQDRYKNAGQLVEALQNIDWSSHRLI